MHNTPSYIKENISIVIQGCVNEKNIIEVSNHCKHWRDILPNSEIILSISTTDCLELKSVEEDTIIHKIINSKYNTSIRNAINSINSSCDIIVYNPESIATPLPPIKDDLNSFNNINHLIESSKLGVSVSTKEFCLKIRNDSIFLDTNFIDFYCKKYNLARHAETSIFQQRVMVPWIYTLNPFAEERLPLHISDWLQFGLTDDIKKIWNIPYYTYADSIFYSATKNSIANIYEKRFNLRIAVEQYIYISFFRKYFPNLKLDFFNDHRDIVLSIDIMVDNFYIFSNEKINFMIRKKYQTEINNLYKRSTCITEDAWKFICINRDIPYKKILLGNVDRNIAYLSKGSFHVDSFQPKISLLHESNNIFKYFIFFAFKNFLPNKMKSKFLLFPQSFFHDSKFRIVRKIGKFYITDTPSEKDKRP